jgi:hypothetical protein
MDWVVVDLSLSCGKIAALASSQPVKQMQKKTPGPVRGQSVFIFAGSSAIVTASTLACFSLEVWDITSIAVLAANYFGL